LRLLVHFDDTIVPTLGQGLPTVGGPPEAAPRFATGTFGNAVRIPDDSELTYPVDGNMQQERGTVALWAQIPQHYPNTSTDRHYLWSVSAHPDNEPYPNTLALRREVNDGTAQWNFWTVDSEGKRHDLRFGDTLKAGSWHHFAVSWDQRGGRKALYIDGRLVADAKDVQLPVQLGDRLQVGRFMPTFGASGALLDELGVWSRVLNPREIQQLAAQQDPYTRASGPIVTARVVSGSAVLFDANAIGGAGVATMQLRRNDEPWTPPLPYYDSYRWTLPDTTGQQTFAVKYIDRNNDATVVTATLDVVAPLTGNAKVAASDKKSLTVDLDIQNVAVPAEYQQVPTAWYGQEIEMQLSQLNDFSDVFWQPYTVQHTWTWQPEQPHKLYVRFRDRQGRVSAPVVVVPH
jgi:hypothetical protein